MSYKLAAINWGREQQEIDDRFIFRINQLRGQSNVLMFGALQAKEIEVAVELFKRLATRMHEILFENAPLIKRVHQQISSVEDWKAASGDNKAKLRILREVFSTHIAIRLFASKEVLNYKMISKLAGDNLDELVKKCNALICDSSF